MSPQPTLMLPKSGEMSVTASGDGSPGLSESLKKCSELASHVLRITLETTQISSSQQVCASCVTINVDRAMQHPMMSVMSVALAAAGPHGTIIGCRTDVVTMAVQGVSVNLNLA